MKRLKIRISTWLVCTLALSVYAFIFIRTAHAGEFGATFNCRLICECSSWHEGKVIGANRWFITVALVRDLLRHAPCKVVRIANRDQTVDALRKGDLVLINYWTKPKRIDWNVIPASFTFTPHFMGRIDRRRNEVVDTYSHGYTSPMLTWFYRTGRWDARVLYGGTGLGFGHAWRAVLPNKKQYLIYDEANPKRPAQYPVH